MTEPSQEAVRAIENAECAAQMDVQDELLRESLLRNVDSALRAVEQRTRLETLERAAVLMCPWCRRGRTVESEWYDGPRFYHPQNSAEPEAACDADGIRSEIASLQPREAPKAEEPKRACQCEPCPTCGYKHYCNLNVEHPATVWGSPTFRSGACPQPGPEEGR